MGARYEEPWPSCQSALFSKPHLCPSSFRPHFLLCEEQERRLWADKPRLPMLDGKSGSLVGMLLGVPLLRTGTVLCPHQLLLWACGPPQEEMKQGNVVGGDL